MSVNVEFVPDDLHGVVAEGTYLWDAAKRLGLRLPAECEGRGECDTCAVIVREGATLLSGLTQAERTGLSPERLAGGERLACQAKIERAGDLVLEPVAVTVRQETAEEVKQDLRAEFREMPLQQKLATLIELEAIQESIASRHGFESTHHTLRMFGTCSDCRGGNRRSKKEESAAEPRVRFASAPSTH